MQQTTRMNDSEQIRCPDDHLQIERLRAIMHRLRSPGGCPWDAEQTHQSLMSNLIEETYEAVDTIRRGDMPHMKEELGDVLLQVVFHSEIAEGNGDFNFDDVAREVSDKLVRRHPHVYADSSVADTEGVLNQWEAIKAQEKGGVEEEKPYLHRVGDGLPAFLKAAKLQKKAAKVGFDWPSASSILAKVQEELDEVKDEMASHTEGGEASEALKDEMGDLFFVVVNMARKLKLNPEELVDRTNQKFLQRFTHVEQSLKSQKLGLVAENLDAMELAWLDAKKST